MEYCAFSMPDYRLGWITHDNLSLFVTASHTVACRSAGVTRDNDCMHSINRSNNSTSRKQRRCNRLFATLLCSSIGQVMCKIQEPMGEARALPLQYITFISSSANHRSIAKSKGSFTITTALNTL